MQLTVSARVMSGFTAVVVLACIIYIVALTGNITIGGSVQKVSNQSVPTLISGNNMLQSVLLSRLSLTQLEQAPTLSAISAIRNQYNLQKQSNDKALMQLSELTESEPELSRPFDNSKKLNTVFFQRADSAFNKAVLAFKLKERTAEVASEFTDMGDETLSLAYDLEGISNDQKISDVVNALIENVENLVDEVSGGLTSNITFEIMNVTSVAKESISDMEQQLTALKNSPELANSDALGLMEENFSQFKQAVVGSDNALQSRINTLNEKKQLSNLVTEASGSAEELQLQLRELNEKIGGLTEDAQQAAEEAIEESLQVTSALTVVTIILSIVIAYFVINSVRTPLHQIIDSINRAAQGDLTVRLDNFKQDEFGRLASNIQKLIDTLAGTLREVTSNTQLLSSTAEQTNMIAEQSCSSASQQSEQMSAMSSSISEMKETVRSVTDSIHSTLEQVQQASSEAASGEELLVTNVQNIKGLESSIETSANAINQLSNELENINTVLAVIRSIAEQTNLLALNAAIEAARAGEQGRGFAVVADEVRTLASRSQDATEEIEKAITGLQDGAKGAVNTMSNSQRETHNCVSGIEAVQGTLSAIVNSVETIKDMSQQIAAASEQQSLAAVSQYDNVQYMHEITNLNSNHAQENKQASQQLAEMAETLRLMMSQFKT
ncbi:methyl-accepting chemotaxis protein [Pseudoalteromonas luteoviolacea]|uniref:methyl-accepting chemotaxis protein n=1 Tax=Pseudoalteromonas luteoviolacea TaxID=43657 RepID=UPI001B36664F|nr:methyl-accepting chemotaxis protein [Pseudoalteromonas luteoviolacea]MBQ4835417.1 HAMP domain-containing protein [Pseudoalteromonas luteoviolacea]